MKKLAEIKQKIKDNRSTIIAYAVATVAVAFGVVSEIRRRECDRELAMWDTVDPDDPWTSIVIPKACVEDMHSGLVMKMRMKTDGTGWYTQHTTKDDFVDDMNGVPNGGFPFSD